MIEINNKKLCESCFSETDAAETCPCCGYNSSEYSPDPMVLPMGTKLGNKIIIGRVMGKGGFGITYLGYDLRMDKTIAVKEYYPNGISYRAPGSTDVSVADTKSSETFESGAEKFYTEAQMVSQFNGNPNIVSVYDYFRANSTVYLIMEYINGITLKNYVKRHGVLTDGQALYVMDKIVAALSITHSAGVLHRDISPDNIMICSDGKVKLIDFGAARQILAESSSNLTVVMKPGYTPIEQYTKKGRQGAWTDIYSLGVSMFYALTKVIIDDPYARMDNDEEFNENKYNIDESLWAILKKCTMINATDRYGSAIELRKALKSVSAPPEQIELTAEDLKDEPEEIEEAEVRSTQAPEDDDFPATVAGDEAEETEEAHSAPASKDDDFPVTVAGDEPDEPEKEEAPEEKTPDDDFPKTVLEDEPDKAPEEKAPGKKVPDKKAAGKKAPDKKTPYEKAPANKKLANLFKNRKMIAAICAAAAIAIVAVIFVFLGMNRSSFTEGNGPVEEIMIKGKKYSTDITSLDLSGKRLKDKDIADLRFMTKLEQIDLSDNRLTDISVLGNITTLVEIDASGNKISDISFLRDLKQMKILVMNDNQVSDISVLSNRPTIEKVWLNDNSVTDISPLYYCPNLVELGLKNCDIGDISALEKKSNLELLSLSNCGITDVSALRTCRQLRELYLGGNDIADTSPLKYLNLENDPFVD